MQPTHSARPGNRALRRIVAVVVEGDAMRAVERGTDLVATIVAARFLEMADRIGFAEAGTLDDLAAMPAARTATAR